MRWTPSTSCIVNVVFNASFIFVCMLVVEGTHKVSECHVQKGKSVTVARFMQTVLQEARAPTMVLFDNDTYWLNVKDFIGNEHVMMCIQIDRAEDFLVQHLQDVLQTSSSLQDIRNRLNFIVFCNNCFQWLTKLVSTLDERKGLQAMRHFSTWLFVTTSRISKLDYHGVHLDNLAVVTISQRKHSKEQFKMGRYYTALLTAYVMEVATLEWVPTGRLWTNVDVDTSSDEDIHVIMFPNMKRGLNRRQLSIGLLQWPLWSLRKGTGENSTYVGAAIDILNILAQTHNFTYYFVEPDDASWGMRMNNGTWTGVIGMVTKQMVDMTGGAFSLTRSRAKVMDFSVPIGELKMVAFYANRKNITHTWFFQDNFFEWRVYVFCVAAVVCATFIYAVMACLQRRYSCPRNEGQHDIGGFVMMIGIAAPLRQGLGSFHDPQPWSAKVFIFFWCSFCLLMTTIYSGRLVAVATVDRRGFPYNNLQELIDQDEYRIVSFDGSAIQNMVKTSNNGIFRKLNDKLENNFISFTDQYLQDGLDVLNGKVVVIIGHDIFHQMRVNSCDLYAMKDIISSKYISFGYPRRSPLKKLFDQTLSYLVDAGVIKEIKRRWLPKPKLCVEEKYTANQFKFSHLGTTFCVCAAGIVLAALTLLFETCRAGRCQPSR